MTSFEQQRFYANKAKAEARRSREVLQDEMHNHFLTFPSMSLKFQEVWLLGFLKFKERPAAWRSE